jgi:hypothetical protein
MRILILALSVCLYTYTLSAQVGIATVVPSAQLELANDPLAPNYPLLELNPQIAPAGTAMGQLAVIGDQLYMYDGVRMKWLSLETCALQFGRSGGVDTQVLRYGGDVGTNNSGAQMPFDGTIVHVSAVANSTTSTKQFDIRVRDNTNVTQSTTSFNLAAGRFSKTDNNVNFSAGNYINVIGIGGTSVNDPTVTIWVKRRK